MAEKAAKQEPTMRLSGKETAFLGISAFSDAFDFFSSLYSGAPGEFSYAMHAWQSENAAKNIIANAEDIVRVGNEKVNEELIRGAKIRGEQRVEMGRSGFSVDSASYENILDETDRVVLMNANAIRESTASQVANAQYQARMQEIQSQLYGTAKRIEKRTQKSRAWGSAISSGAKLAFMSYYGGAND